MPPQQNPYEFMDQPPAQSSGGFSMNDNNSKHRMLVVGGGAVLLLILFFLFYTLVLAHKPATGSLLSLAQQQNELIQISTSAQKNAVQQPTKNLAANALATLATSQTQLSAYLKKHHLKVTSKQLAAGMNATVTQELTQAQTASEFDAVYVQVMQNQVAKYATVIDQCLSATAGKTETIMLNNDMVVAKALLSQANTLAGTPAGT